MCSILIFQPPKPFLGKEPKMQNDTVVEGTVMKVLSMLDIRDIEDMKDDEGRRCGQSVRDFIDLFSVESEIVAAIEDGKILGLLATHFGANAEKVRAFAQHYFQQRQIAEAE